MTARDILIASLYQRGHSMRQITDATSVPLTTVWSALKRRGITRRRRGNSTIPDQTLREAVEMWAKGATFGEIGKHQGNARSTAYRRVKRGMKIWPELFPQAPPTEPR